MRYGWQKSTIGTVCNVIAGQSPKGIYYNSSSDGLPFYQGKKEFGDKYIGTPTKWTTHITREAIAGDILMSVRAPVGPINFATERICIGRGLAAIRSGENINQEFLFYALWAMQKHIQGSEGAVFASINKKQIESLPFFYPSLTEQQRIVAILDEAFAAIDTATVNAERNWVNAQALFESELNRTFEKTENHWAESLLGDLITVKHGFAFKSDWFSDTGDAVLLTPGNFYETGGYRDRGKKQKYYVGDIPKDFVLAAGDLLVAMTEQAPGLLGSPMIVPESGQFLHNQRLGLVQAIQGVTWHTKFFFHLFNTKAYRDRNYIDASGVKVRHTSPKKIYNVSVRYPQSIDEQQRIAQKLDNIKMATVQLAEIYQQKLTLLAELKQSILHKAFTGELTADVRVVERMMAAV
ncbi:MAG: restriction endonuclease subunit S [Chloroflexota bacterium]